MHVADDPLAGLTVHSNPWWAAVYETWGTSLQEGVLAVYKSRSRIIDGATFDDVVEEAFLQVMDNTLIDSTTKNIGGFLRTVGRRRALDHVKRATHVAEGEVPETGNIDIQFEDAEDAVLREQIGAIAWDNLHRLSPREVRVWRALESGDRTHAEIAAEEGITREAVSLLAKRIPRKLLRGTGWLTEEQRGDDK